jgi:rifampicin phosphotransferase
MSAISNNLIWDNAGLGKITEREAGGKGWNLFRLQHFGFPVPSWFIVSSQVFDQVFGSQKERIQKILDSLDFNDKKNLDEASGWIGQIISQSKLAEQFCMELSTAVDKMFDRGVLVSVRSSVVGEDSKENSFAGQMDSFLNVHPSQVTETIKKVRASAFSSRALLYRHRKNISLSEISAAVIVQEMVQSVASGVLFTKDPENRKNQCIISAGFGLGEGVVTNLVETDTYRIDWKSNRISKEVKSKDRRVVLDSTNKAGNRLETIPAEMQMMPVLTDKQILRLRDLGVKAERLFGLPQDIEWAGDEKGRIFILQTRPIVFGTKQTSLPKIRIWDNSNIVESYPEITLPLTFSFARRAYEMIFRQAILGFLPFKKELKNQLSFTRNMIGILDGRIYYNLLNWYEMLSFLPGFKKHKDSWDQMIGISQKISFPEGKLSRINRFGVWLNVILRLLSVKRTAGRFFEHFNPVYDHFRNIDISKMTEDELIAVYESLDLKLTNKWHLTLYNDFCAMKYYDWLKQICTKWGLDQYPNLHNDLLSGQKDMESIRPVESLMHLAEILHTEAIFEELMSEPDNETILKKIEHDHQYAMLKDAIDAHLRAFGDRGMEELKLEKPTFLENPAALIGLVKNYYQSGINQKTIEIHEETIRVKAEEKLKKHLKNPFKRFIFRFVLRNARLAIINRENMRFARSRLYGIIRRLFRRMGELFEEKGMLQSSSDIYYLTVDEVFAWVQGTAVTQNLKALVELRKAEYLEFSQHAPKERIETQGMPYLSSFGHTKVGNQTSKTLRGIGCSSGVAEGTARVVLSPDSPVASGINILIARSTDPGWVFLMLSSKGIVVEKGSVLSHTAIIGRELGIPTIVGVRDATRLIQDGARISINGSIGEVKWK